MSEAPHIHGAASLAVVPVDETHATAVFQGRSDLALSAANCEFQRTSDIEWAMTCPNGLDGVPVRVLGLSEADSVLVRLGTEGGILTAATPEGTLRTPTRSHLPLLLLALALVGIAALLARPRTLPIPRALVAYALGGVGVWLLLVGLTGS